MEIIVRTEETFLFLARAVTADLVMTGGQSG